MSSARQRGQQHSPPPSAGTANAAGSAAHQHSASPTRMPQLKATPQRGQTLGVSFIGVSSPMFVRMQPRG